MRSLNLRRFTLAIIVLATVLPTAAALADDEFPDNWYFLQRDGTRYPGLARMEGQPAPALTLNKWIGEAQDLAALQGKVVVVDFWATWCGPCMKALPHNVQLMKKYAKEGLMVIGAHDAKRGHEKMAQVAKEKRLNYPLGVDVNGASTKAWNIRFWPTYFVIDREGTVRAAGLVPNRVDDVVKRLLKEEVKEEPKQVAVKRDVSPSWLEGDAAKRARLDALGETPPPLSTDSWMNSDPLSLEALKGKVVMIDFWATWCGPCRRATPHTNELYATYKEQGLVVIGVCAQRGHEKMAESVAEWDIQFPVCADTTGSIVQSYFVNGYPDYYFIDRSGRLRIADCKNASVDEAIEFLLAEK